MTLVFFCASALALAAGDGRGSEQQRQRPTRSGTLSPRCGLIRLGISLPRSCSACMKRLRRRELILVGRILQQFGALVVGGLLFRRRAGKAEVAEGVLFVEQHAVEEGELRVDAMAENDVGHLVREHGGQAGLVGKHVDQAAAEDDGVADGERLERGGHQARGSEFPARYRGYW